MRLNIIGDLVVVTLSERNLRSLLAKLEGHPPNSHKTITSQFEDGLQLIVHAETDEEHYEGRPFAPGIMHPATETAMKALNKEKEHTEKNVRSPVVAQPEEAG